MRVLLSYLLWPLLMAGAIASNAVAMQADGALWQIVAFNAGYLGLALALFGLERTMPFEPEWNQNDGQMLPDIGHTAISKIAVQILIISLTLLGLAQFVPEQGAQWWPRHWPLAVQVVLGLVIAEFGLYWSHRWLHEVPLLWRFHAVHHSVKRLWFWNTVRFHFGDTFTSVALGLGTALIAGLPYDIIVWVSAITAYIGLLTHCNVEMRCGWLNYVFNTPELHRWHHSMVPEEGNRNYGENLMIFDHLFRSFFYPDRRPPKVIGIRDDMPPMPATLSGQIAYPFRRQATAAIVPAE
jgi:sterol desaturase/sphingolipid hydroxylase (fatty acid hydroxylase superfamily)